MLNVRLCKGKSPKRIILDETLKISTILKLLNKPLSDNTIVFSTKNYDREIEKILLNKGVKIYLAKENKNGYINLKDMLRKAAKCNISSILVEGGAEIFTSFIRAGLVDKIYLFIAPKVFFGGINTFDNSFSGLKSIGNINLKFEKIKKVGKDLLIESVI